jgi:hypothetical protein
MFHSALTPTDAPDPAVIGRLTSTATMGADTAVGILVVLFLLLVAAGAALTIWLVIRSRAKARVAALSPAERELHDARLEYRSRITAAERALDTATKERTHRLKASEKAVAKAHSATTQTLASYRGRDGAASVTPMSIVVPQGTFPLTASVSATVDTAGNLATSSRSTLTRVGAGAMLFGPVGAIVGATAKKTRMHDTRELYLLVQGDQFATLITCNPDDGAHVRQFAIAVRQAALNADAARAALAQSVAQAEQALAWEQQNTAPVDAARSALHQVTADTIRLDAANRAATEERARTAGADPTTSAS